VVSIWDAATFTAVGSTEGMTRKFSFGAVFGHIQRIACISTSSYYINLKTD
jgi:hypothetical protein